MRDLRHILAAALLIGYCTAAAQVPGNMVYNGSFEEHITCPDRVDAIGIMDEVEAWWQPTAGSSDYFHECGSRESAVPRNKMGFQQPHSGKAYCGIYCSQEHYREYLQTELREPLVAGGRYRVSFWVSLADKAPHAIATLGAMLSTERLSDSTYEPLSHRERDGGQIISSPFSPQVISHEVIDEMQGWVEVAGEMVAEGDERYLTIGNFASFNRSRVVPTNASNAVLQGAYYYVDDVSVVRIDSEPRSDTLAAQSQLAEGDIIELRGVYFATDESHVLPQSHNELAHLLEVMLSHPTLCIELRGHTDNQGTVAHNQRLSEARAKAVADYLTSHGIEGRRLSWHGYGESMPIADNATPEGRAHNRRVEMRVIKL